VSRRFTFDYDGWENIPVSCGASYGVPVSDAMWARYQLAHHEFESCLRLLEELAKKYYEANPPKVHPGWSVAMASVAAAPDDWPSVQLS
jgi:hypothetical protein